MLAGKFKKGFDRWDNFYAFHLNFVLPLDGWVFAGARSEYLSSVAAAHHP